MSTSVTVSPMHEVSPLDSGLDEKIEEPLSREQEHFVTFVPKSGHENAVTDDIESKRATITDRG